MRAPHTTRERPSRPRSSVPKGCASDGALRIWLQSVRVGSLGAIHGAPRAITTNSATMAAPTTAAGRRRPTSHARRQRPAGGAAAADTGSGIVAVLSAIGRAPDADARIEYRVGDVYQQVDDH